MKEKQIWLDALRVISTISVVILHVSSAVLYKYGTVSNSIWNTANIYDGMVRFCVPVFFMISGALLLSKDYELSDFFKRRFFRIIPPLVFWSLIYIYYDYAVIGEKTFTVIAAIKMVIRNLFSGSQYHLWFVYTLLGLYLFIPVLRQWTKNATNKNILYFLIVWFVTILYNIPNIKAYLPNIPLANFSGYIGYLVLGYYLSNLSVKNKVMPILCIVLGMIITIYGTYYITHKNNTFYEYFYGNLTPNVLLCSTGVFLLVKTLVVKNKRVKNVILFLSNHSFGVYLVHVLVLTLLSKFGVDWTLAHPAISIPVTAIACLIIATLIIYLLRKIKYGVYISG